MKAELFLDTNVLVYAAAGGQEEEAKRLRALELLEEPGLGLSGQVLQEFYVTVTRKLASPVPVPEALEWLELLSIYPVLPIDGFLVQRGAWFSERYRVSYWDGAILAAAEGLGAPVVYSEDLNHGQRYGSVQVLNPFLG
ncbi:MAG: PIN domain-containing protein [Acidobacteria bacterium]|nr:PIN domain-containing protein [Acidobacteriota bacterium]